METASWVSKSIGSTTVTYQTTGTSVSKTPGRYLLDQTAKSTSSSTHMARRDLLTPDEVMRLDVGLEILVPQGQAPVIAQKLHYFCDPEFQGLFQG